MEKKGTSPFEEPVRTLKEADPEEIAGRTGVTWQPEAAGGGLLEVPVLNGLISVRFPEVSVEATPGVDSFTFKLLTVLYLCNSDGTRPSGSWVAYRELPGGRFYEPVVRRSVEDPLVEAFGSRVREFNRAAVSLGGTDLPQGDAAYWFDLFPMVPLSFILWEADQEFPARAQVLFDSNCSHHLDAFNLRMGAQETASRLIGGVT